MASVNKVILVGNLGRNPEVRYTPDGVAMTTVSVATTSAWKDRNSGERREETEWHRVVMIGRLAEVAGEYLTKGASAYFEGRLRTRKWKDRTSGQDRYTTEIVADQMQMLGGRPSEEHQPERNTSRQAQSQPQHPSQQSTGASAGIADDDGDCPF